MPQLDFTIVFSQIFWLFLIFFILYTILVHFFLPKFLVSIKSRKQIIELNLLKVSELQQGFSKNQFKLQQALTASLVLVRSILNENWTSTIKYNGSVDLTLVDKKISLVVFNSTQYCDVEILNQISLNPKSLNLRTYNYIK